ncbi:TPA: hypothetical protein ACHK5K_004458, partial [Escherichia coli]
VFLVVEDIMDNQNTPVFDVCGWYCVPVKDHNSVIVQLSCKQPPFESDKIIESPIYSFPIKEIPNLINTLQNIYEENN